MRFNYICASAKNKTALHEDGLDCDIFNYSHEFIFLSVGFEKIINYVKGP